MEDLIDVKITATDVLRMLPPYPIVLVSTRTNVITINQVMYFTFAPLRVGVAIAHAHHTCDLLEEEQEFVINVPGEHLLDAVKQCGILSGRDGDKFTRVGLTPLPAAVVTAVRIAECSAFIECQVDRQMLFEHRTWFIGKVAAATMRPSHQGAQALMCGRHAYRLPGDIVAPR